MQVWKLFLSDEELIFVLGFGAVRFYLTLNSRLKEGFGKHQLLFGGHSYVNIKQNVRIKLKT